MSPLNPSQEQVLRGLTAADAALVVRIDDLRGILALARGTLLGPGPADPEATVRTFLERTGGLFGPANAATWLRLLRRWRDPMGWTHLEYQQDHDPGSGTRLEVYGAKLVAHVAADGSLAEIQSSCWSSVDVPGQAQVTADALRAQLLKAAATSPDFPPLSEMMAAHGESRFPLMQLPRLVAYFWRDRFYLAWSSYAYVPVPELQPPGAPAGALHLDLRHILFDAVTGDEILTSPTSMHVDNPVLGSGLSVQGSRPAPVNRVLNVVQEDATTQHRLRDTTHSRDIITYDLGQLPQGTTIADIGMGLVDGLLTQSTSTGSNWGATWPTFSRVDSQQPEVDAHFLTGRVYEWYDAVSGGRAGWDNGSYPTTTVPANLPVRVMTHVPPARTVNSMMTKQVANSVWYPFLLFWDCDPTLKCPPSSTADRAQDYWAGSFNIVAHEYQHAITAFSFQDGAGNPGIGYQYWSAALHEGLSDAFAALCSESWSWGPEVSLAGVVIRSAAYPRDPNTWENLPGTYPCSQQHGNKDHFADQNLDMTVSPGDWSDRAQAYNHGTILAHCAYLMGQGGVHQRLARAPALIPVEGLGRETRAGLSVLKAARIWYHTLVDKLAAYAGTATGNLNADAHVFYAVGDGCVSTASLLFGTGSVEHRTAALAVYAVGLQEPGTLYGADVTFLRWGWDWRYSRPYLGGIYANAPDWASLDLFVNNGGGPSGWTAVIDPGNLATPPENQVYCRVRNVGDQAATSVTVAFSYAKISTVAGPWQPVTDRNGNVQTLNVGTLAAGQMTFGDTQADQDAPPAAAMVKWWIPPLAPGEVVDHFCLKADVTSTNDVNPYNNEVQSNVAYVQYSPAPRALRLWNEAVLHAPGPVETVVTAILPPRWRVTGPAPGEPPAGREAYASTLGIEMPADALDHIEAPFDGEIVAQLTGSPSGNAHGALTMLTGAPPRLSGRAALTLPGAGLLLGTFKGSLDPHTAAVKGNVEGAFQSATTGRTVAVNVRLEGRLAPWRRVDVSQRADGQTLGGLTVQIYGGAPGAVG